MIFHVVTKTKQLMILKIHRVSDNNYNFCFFQAEFNKKNTFYVFNHVDIKITYHSGELEGWRGARLVAATLEPRR